MKLKLLSVLVLSAICSKGQNTWTQAGSIPYGGNTSASLSLTVNNTAYYFRSDFSNNLLTNWSYDPVQNTWTQKASLTGGRYERAATFTIGNIGYIGTGIIGSSQLTTNFWAYDPATNSYSSKASCPGAVAGASSFVINNIGYVVSGFNNISSNTTTASVYAYDPVTDSWTTKAPLPAPRANAAGFALNGYGYVVCGRPDYSTFTSTNFKYNPQTDQWTSAAPYGGQDRISPVSFVLGNKAYVGTGFTGSSTSSFYEYDDITDTWTQRANCTVSTTYSTGFAVNGKGYVAGGSAGSTLYQYTPPLTTSISENNPLQFSVYPSPASNFLQITGASGLREVVIFDLNGREVMKSENGETRFDLSPFSEGSYLVKVSDGSRSSTKQIIIRR